MKGRIKYSFETKMWRHTPSGGWYFVSLPTKRSLEIRNNLKQQEEGWGRMKTTARIEEITWDTSIWFDTKMERYLLPIKAEIRKKTNIEINKKFKMDIWL